jgi:hypothetical protein
MGAAFLGIGLLAGFLLPATRNENEWFGEASDAVRSRIKEAGQDLVNRGKHVAQAATEAARSEAERRGLSPEQVKEGLKAVGRETYQAAQRTAEEEGMSPEALKKKT